MAGPMADDTLASPSAPAPPSTKEADNLTTITEGLATIGVPKLAGRRPGSSSNDAAAQDVFYNPRMQVNRDISVLVISEFAAVFTAARSQRMAKSRSNKAAKAQKKRKREGPEPLDAAEPTMMPDGPAAASASDLTKPTKGVEQSEVAETTEVPKEPEASVSDDIIKPTEVPKEPEASVSDDTIKPTEVAVEKKSVDAKASKTTFTILDALAATGLRAIRYAREIPFVTSITANDLSPAAAKAIELNVERNNVKEKVKTTTGNALAIMYAAPFSGSHSKFDVIDLDPYGTAAPFFDAAVQALNDGGLLCATLTDPGVWASNGYPEKAFALYGGVPVKGKHCHEAGLRLILHAIAVSAARYGLAIEPLLSLSLDYYARVFVRVWRSPAKVKFLAGKTMLVYGCDYGCGAWTTQPLVHNKQFEDRKGGKQYKHSIALGPSASEFCSHCGFKTHVSGPMYAGPIHSSSFVGKVLERLAQLDRKTYGTIGRMEGVLTTALEEDINPELVADAGTNKRQKKGHSASSSGEVSRPDEVSNARDEFDASQIDHHPFFVIPSALAGILHCKTPTENAIRGALKHLGYRVTRSHTQPGSIKTSAPWSVIWTVMREWVRQKAPIKEESLKEGTAGWHILHKSPPAEPVEVIFDEEFGAADRNKAGKRLTRYQVNPTPNWGPMTRAKGATQKPQRSQEVEVGKVAAEAAPEDLPDTAPDAEPDTLPDAAAEAGPDTLPEAAPNAAPNAELEALPKVAPEAGLEILPEAAPEAVPETLPDAAPDAELETLPEVALEAGLETEPDAASEAALVAMPETPPELTLEEDEVWVNADSSGGEAEVMNEGGAGKEEEPGHTGEGDEEDFVIDVEADLCDEHVQE